jgi:hypothetical protein
MSPDQPTNYWQEEEDPDNKSTESESATSPKTMRPSEQLKAGDDTMVNWAASEYIHLEKNGLWYVLFAAVALTLIATDIFLIRSYTFSALVIVMVIAVIVYSRRPSHTIQYALSGKQGLYIGEHLYHFSDFRAFGLVQDNENHSIMLIPTKRFSASLQIYFPKEVGEKIVDILGTRLPIQPLKLDIIDVVVRKLHL